MKSAGMARQYCGQLCRVANCQAVMFLAYVSPLSRALVDKRLHLPESWTSDPERYAAAGVPEERRSYRPKTELALAMLERALESGHSGPNGLPQTTPSEYRHPSGDPWRPWEFDTCWRFRATPRRGLLGRLAPGSEYEGSGRPRKPRSREGRWRTMEQRSDELPEGAWREIAVGEGS